MKKFGFYEILCTAFVLSATFGSIQAQDTVRKQEISVKEWLVSDIYPFASPAFSKSLNIRGEKLDASFLLQMPWMDIQEISDDRPRAAKGLWKTASGENYKTFFPRAKDSTVSQGAWHLYAVYLKSSAYRQVDLSFSFSPVYELYLDGKKILSRNTSISADSTGKIAEQKKSLDIEPGFHVLLVRALLTPADSSVLLPQLFLKAEDSSLVLGTQLEEFYDLDHYMFGTSVFGPQLSHQGSYFLLGQSSVNKDKDAYEYTYLLGKTSDMKIVSSYKGISHFSFAPHAPYYGYMERKGKYKQIYLGCLGEKAELAYQTKEDLGGFTWDPQGRFLILSFSTAPDKNTSGLKNLVSPADQWPEYRERTLLYELELNQLKGGKMRLLTFGSLSADLQDVSAEGRYILFSTSEMVDTMRNFMQQRMYKMDLQTLQTQELWKTRLFDGTARFAPDGRSLFVVGSERMFASDSLLKVWETDPRAFIPNDYNKCAFVYDLNSGKIDFVGKDFKPSIESFSFDPSGRYVYLLADDRDERSIYAYGTDNRSFSKVALSLPVAQSFALCANALLYVATSATEPTKAYLKRGNTSNLASLKEDLLVSDPQADLREKNVKTSPYIDLKFRTPLGDSIEGTLYLPLGLSLVDLQKESKKYPCITYYYGGTAPTTKVLAMRYPKEVWATHGYAVLVLQPSGAIGYGSSFAARHVNDWGKTVADEIIAALKQTCKNYAFIDSSRIGCIGASYGGFMTQYLVSRTSLFSAAISHAGISSLSSYWGEGYWGYLYNGVASANSYPWNRRDIYVDQSPLFSADKIHTPLLLLHGTSDHNVPIGESYQMYKALRILGRPVAMVTVEGEDHGIVNLPKRMIWEKTILAWFDKHLKGEDAWWNALYPPLP